jgi:hypothetical protein
MACGRLKPCAAHSAHNMKGLLAAAATSWPGDAGVRLGEQVVKDMMAIAARSAACSVQTGEVALAGIDKCTWLSRHKIGRDSWEGSYRVLCCACRYLNLNWCRRYCDPETLWAQGCVAVIVPLQQRSLFRRIGDLKPFHTRE